MVPGKPYHFIPDSFEHFCFLTGEVFPNIRRLGEIAVLL
jgi:hypothetical protein